ncbi:MAG: diacylglycerol kinase family lipid kinase [Clostridiales bacterium]|nr:diacylglycerol kinase family lipid kinase [Clostridiales bacterium]
MSKQLMLILNPAAGGGKGVTAIGSAMEVLYRGGYIPTVFYTLGTGEATKLVLEHAKEYDCVVCVGGDGTLSETVAGLAQLDSPPPLGYIPQGTANDVAASLGLSKNPVRAAKAIVQGHTGIVKLDVGKFNENDYFTYIAAFGAFTEVSYETPREQKQALGHLAYVLQGMSQLPKLTYYPAVVEYDDGVVEEDLLFGSVSNTKSVGGIVRLKDAEIELDDGVFEVTLVRNPKNVMEKNKIVSNILSQNFSGGPVTMLRSRRVKFTFDRPVKWTRDGEAGGAHQEVVLENLHSAIKFIV